MPCVRSGKNEGVHTLKSGYLRLDSPPSKLRVARPQISHSVLFVSVTTIAGAEDFHANQ